MVPVKAVSEVIVLVTDMAVVMGVAVPVAVPLRVPVAERRVDPRRRDRIIEAAISVIGSVGVAGASHRAVAVRAGVPLGSMTYHFAGITELLGEAFSRFSAESAERYEAKLLAATTPASARIAVVELIHDDLHRSAGDRAVALELYALAARDPEIAVIATEWRRRIRVCLARHFGAAAAVRLDAFVEGATLQRLLDPRLAASDGQDRTATFEAVSRIAAER